MLQEPKMCTHYMLPLSLNYIKVIVETDVYTTQIGHLKSGSHFKQKTCHVYFQSLYMLTTCTTNLHHIDNHEH